VNPVKVILIAGRSIKQGKGISHGKHTAEYKDAVSTLQLSKEDMASLGVENGNSVRMKSDGGEVVVQCKGAKLPEGVAFIAYGPMSSALMGRETHGSGMPDSRGFEVEVERVD